MRRQLLDCRVIMSLDWSSMSTRGYSCDKTPLPTNDAQTLLGHYVVIKTGRHGVRNLVKDARKRPIGVNIV